MNQKSSVFRPVNRSHFEARFCSILSAQQLGGIVRQYGRRKGPSPKVGTFGLIRSMVFHFLQSCGSLGTHVKEITGKKLSEAALSKRRTRLDWKIFEKILEVALQVRAVPQLHPQAFFGGLRLVGIDGSMFSVFNTPAILQKMKKTSTSRGFEAAFAKLGVSLLVELGLHNPIAVVISKDGDSELSLAYRLLDKLPQASLLIADRLYSAGVFLMDLLESATKKNSYFLVRVPSHPTSQLLTVLVDGSSLVEIVGGRYNERAKKVKFLAREIRGVIVDRSGKRTEIRLWTSLLDEKAFPALDLLKLYGRRWEQEITFYELKVSLKGSGLLQSYTPETAMQEIASLVIAQAILVQMRMAAAENAQLPVLQVSFAKVLHYFQGLWNTLYFGEDVFSPEQEEKMILKTIQRLGELATPPRRNRTCPREVRQPIGRWRKLHQPQSSNGELQFEVLKPA